MGSTKMVKAVEAWASSTGVPLTRQAARSLIEALTDTGHLVPDGAVIETLRAHGRLIDNGQCVQAVAPGDPDEASAQWYARHVIHTPWAPSA